MRFAPVEPPRPPRSSSLRDGTLVCTFAASAALVALILGGAGCRRPNAEGSQPSGTETPSAPSDETPVDPSGNPIFQDGKEPQVSLSGQARSGPAPTIHGDTIRLGALGWKTPIHKQPDPASNVLGYLRVGAVVDAKKEPSGHKECKGGWHRIAPFGHVCVAKRNATKDVNHELVRASSRRPDTGATLPYMYGTVRRPGPIYGRLPSRKQAARAEPGLEKRMGQWFELEDHNGASFRADFWLRSKENQQPQDPAELWEQSATLDVPPYLEGGRLPPGNLSRFVKNKDDIVVSAMKRHNGFAFVDTVVYEGRRYGVTTRFLVMPVDRLRPIKGSRRHGFEIPKDIDFPFVIVRRKRANAYAYADGKVSKAKKIERWQAFKLTGKQNFFGGRLHYETTEGLWVSDRDTSRLDPARRMPAWGKNGERWIDINITKQTAVAYDGTKAVFATLISTGEAGLGDPETSRATKRGIFRVDRKHLTATMDSEVVGEEFELRDIPYVQYFEGGYALHAAYWHDDFGTPRSHGCINLTPEDARRLFFWTEPKLPPGWHSVRRPLTGSVLFVHP